MYPFFLCCFLSTQRHVLIRSCKHRTINWYQSDLAAQRQQTTETTEKKKTRLVKISLSQKNEASTSETGVEIKTFDGKNFALWKEMMHNVLIIRRQVKLFDTTKNLLR